MTKIIKFHAQDEYSYNVKEKPVPALQYLPKWFKEASIYIGGKQDPDPGPNSTFKKCAPLMDGLSFGYIMPLWSDIKVTQKGGVPTIQWATNYPVVDVWPLEQTHGYGVPEGFSHSVFKYLHGWIPETPKGYSCLITHPTGYQSLPFKTITGIIDSDILKTEANAPFVIREGFEGIIKKGTPMFQILPFKRDDWDSEYDFMPEQKYFFQLEKLHTKFFSAYSSIKAKRIYR